MSMTSLRRRAAERGFTLIELMIVIAIILIIAAIAVPKLSSQKQTAQEMAAISQIRSLNQAQIQYYGQFGRYANSLTELGPPASGATGPSAADIIPKSLADGRGTGYIFTMAGTQGGYTINANPEQFGSTGRRTFYSDQTGVIRQNWTQEPAGVNSAELSAGAGSSGTAGAAPASTPTSK
jgi:prepilin-type N-terminal cleavage/methylation domain-containing protein